MKNYLILAAAIAATVLNMSANNQFSMSPNDTVRVHPNRLSGYTQQVVTMETDAFCDSWSINMSYPEGTMVKLVSGITPLSGMLIDYTTATGDWVTYEAVLNVSAAYGSITSSTGGTYGFYDYSGSGTFIPYGTVKWEPGLRQMFSLNIYIEPTFREGWLIMDAVFNSSADSRGPILSNVRSYKRTFIWVGYEKGDVNGDGNINITDVTLLITALEKEGGNPYLDEWSMAAADYNRDGVVNITDATALIAYTLNNR